VILARRHSVSRRKFRRKNRFQNFRPNNFGSLAKTYNGKVKEEANYQKKNNNGNQCYGIANDTLDSDHQ